MLHSVDSVQFPGVGDRSISRHVYAAIVESVRTGELRPGDRINEAALSRRLGISRTPVREAVIRLCQEGLLVAVPRRGAFLPQVTEQDVNDVAVVRALIEGFAAGLACRRASLENLAELDRLVEEMRLAAERGDWIAAIQTNGR